MQEGAEPAILEGGVFPTQDKGRNHMSTFKHIHQPPKNWGYNPQNPPTGSATDICH